MFLRYKVQYLYPKYLKFSFLSPDKRFGKGYPRGYFVVDDSNGFDINKSLEAITVNSIPAEAGEYQVWSNGLGCFDVAVRAGKPYYLYLAGDSQTWGYAPFKDKFGSILEGKLGRPVAKCGVTHTGQQHQFRKFKEVASRLGYFPPIVVINVVPNDLENDFLFPQATVVDGYLINQARLDAASADQPSQLRSSRDELLEKYDVFRNSFRHSRFVRALDPRQYLASGVLVAEAIKRWPMARQKQQSSPFYAIDSELAESNRNALELWAEHARQNDYELVVATATIEKPGFYKPLEPLLENLGVRFWDFSEFAHQTGIDPAKVRWKRDGHFNVIGNKLYAEFLYENLLNI